MYLNAFYTLLVLVSFMRKVISCVIQYLKIFCNVSSLVSKLNVLEIFKLFSCRTDGQLMWS
jgi:hypothetical protein